jgi:hypothetical protein
LEGKNSGGKLSLKYIPIDYMMLFTIGVQEVGV